MTKSYCQYTFRSAQFQFRPSNAWGQDRNGRVPEIPLPSGCGPASHFTQDGIWGFCDMVLLTVYHDTEEFYSIESLRETCSLKAWDFCLPLWE
jgi:hypothetical protein